MITNLRTAYKILESVGLSSVDAAAFLAVAMAKLPTGADEGGDERKTTGKRASMAVIDVCREMKADGWKPTPVAVALLAGERLVENYGKWTLDEWQRADAAEFEERVLQAAGVATVSADEVANLPDPPTLHDRLVTTGASSPTRDRAPMRSLPPLTSPPQSVQEMIDEDREDRYTTTPGDDGGEPDPTIDGTAEATSVAEPEAVSATAPETGGGASLDDEPVTDPAWEEAIGEICAEAEAAANAAQVEAFPTATESRALARTLVDAILDSHDLEMGPDGVVRKVDTTVPDEAVTATPIVGHAVDVVSVEDPDFSPTGAADATPAPKKPRCGLTHGWYETEPPRPMLCNRVQGHKGKCGPVKAGEKADGSVQ